MMRIRVMSMMAMTMMMIMMSQVAAEPPEMSSDDDVTQKKKRLMALFDGGSDISIKSIPKLKGLPSWGSIFGDVPGSIPCTSAHRCTHAEAMRLSDCALVMDHRYPRCERRLGSLVCLASNTASLTVTLSAHNYSGYTHTQNKI